MNETLKIEKQQRINELEDRKIELLIVIANINKEYEEKVTRLNSEYEKLHKELYYLQVDLISNKNDLMQT